ncbi:MAG: chemoreceptor glutamine deamidase CheD [Proteobacteria bacterium]|nr:chemoreceptor glutamine deamidase CheD [Pseudomonadota bacterium]
MCGRLYFSERIMSSSVPLPATLPGFEKIHRFWDYSKNMPVVKLQPGEFYVTTNEEAIITILGSCVCACVRDVDLGVGGMNHFMLPSKGSLHQKLIVNSDDARYGNWAMEFLINQILNAGGRRRLLEVKIFGGANVFQSLSSNIGDRNIQFIEEYLENERLAIKAKDLGGFAARIIVYFPKTGKVQLKYLDEPKKYEIVEKERKYLKQIDKTLSDDGNIELF